MHIYKRVCTAGSAGHCATCLALSRVKGAYVCIHGALLVPECKEEGVWVHRDVQNTRNLPLALNAHSLQVLCTLLVCNIDLAAPARIQSCTDEGQVFKPEDVVVSRYSIQPQCVALRCQEAGILIWALTFTKHGDCVALVSFPFHSCWWHRRCITGVD